MRGRGDGVRAAGAADPSPLDVGEPHAVDHDHRVEGRDRGERVGRPPQADPKELSDPARQRCGRRRVAGPEGVGVRGIHGAVGLGRQGARR